MDLPTYTNIWRIEKRLYKLYDFRLPMPLPVGQIAVFAAIAAPYAIALTVLGLPFSHTLAWLYVLPPGALAWLATRPVLESKRLPELILSQLRYLTEPRTWCRMAPLAEKDEITLTCRVWRRARKEHAAVAEQAAAQELSAGQVVAGGDAPLKQPKPVPAGQEVPVVVGRPVRGTGRHAATSAVPAGPGRVRWPAAITPPAREHLQAHATAAHAQAVPVRGAADPPATAAHARSVPVRGAADPPATAAYARAVPGQAALVAAQHPVIPVVAHAAHDRSAPSGPAPSGPSAQAGSGHAQAGSAPAGSAQAERAAQKAPPARPVERPVVTVTSEPAPERPLRVVERALNASPAHRGDGWRDHVVVVPGGHRPGRPDQQQRDRARAQLPVSGPCRVVVLGCTVGAGQTMTTLMTGEMLASLRADPVAVLDLNPGSGSLAERARAVPAVTQDWSPAGRGPDPARESGQRPPPSRLEVISRSAADVQDGADDVSRMFELISARYSLTLADPAASAVPRVLAIADQLVLVAPASADAASAIAMTYEWLEAHGHAALACAAITVLNGVSRPTMGHVEQAEAVARGRCRAIVRVPWDDQLRNYRAERARACAPAAKPHQSAGSLNPAAVHAYTALAGVLIAGLADAPQLRRARI